MALNASPDMYEICSGTPRSQRNNMQHPPRDPFTSKFQGKGAKVITLAGARVRQVRYSLKAQNLRGTQKTE